MDLTPQKQRMLTLIKSLSVPDIRDLIFMANFALELRGEEPEMDAEVDVALAPKRLATVTRKKAKRKKGKSPLKGKSLDTFRKDNIILRATWEAFKKSSGFTSGAKLQDRAELSQFDPSQVQSALGALFRGRHGRVMERQKEVLTVDGDVHGWQWTYRYKKAELAAA
jgi:hypothetical protein